MKVVNQQVVKEIESIADRLQVSKKVAAEAMLNNCIQQEMMDTAKHVQLYLDLCKD